jgi:N-acetylneuraminic acid mutarotase
MKRNMGSLKMLLLWLVGSALPGCTFLPPGWGLTGGAATPTAPVATPAPPAGGAWAAGRPMPTYRSEFAAAVLDDRIYVLGGLAGRGARVTEVTTVVEVYDPAADAWSRAADLPLPLHHLGAAGVAGRLVVAGGYDGDDFTADVRATWVYDPAADTWARGADMPAPRAAHALAAVGDRVYAAGGVGPDSTQLWAYDPAADRWTILPVPLPTAREHLTAAALDGRLYVIGGRWGGLGNLPTVEVYDPATGGWTRGRDMPTPRGGLTAAALRGQIHVTGGEELSGGRTFAQHEAYSPATDTWAALPDLPTARHGLASAATAGRWYVLGGGAQAGGATYNTLTNLVEVFTP